MQISAIIVAGLVRAGTILALSLDLILVLVNLLWDHQLSLSKIYDPSNKLTEPEGVIPIPQAQM